MQTGVNEGLKSSSNNGGPSIRTIEDSRMVDTIVNFRFATFVDAWIIKNATSIKLH